MHFDIYSFDISNLVSYRSHIVVLYIHVNIDNELASIHVDNMCHHFDKNNRSVLSAEHSKLSIDRNDTHSDIYSCSFCTPPQPCLPVLGTHCDR
jgi:hypothetical protein